MENKQRIYYTKDGWVCDRYPYDLAVDDKERYIEVSEEDYDKTLSTKSHYSWKVTNGKLIEEPYEKILEDEQLETLRSYREEICFPIINRGQLWYDTLTTKQKEELVTWYKAWLDITETKQEPLAPEWLFNFEEQEERRVSNGKYKDSSAQE